MATERAIKIKRTTSAGANRTNTFGNGMWRTDASDQQLIAAAEALDSLQSGTMTNAYAVDTRELDID